MDASTEKHYRALELDKILDRLAGQTSCPDAAEAARAIAPSSDLDEVRRRLTQTEDAFQLSGRFGAPSFGGLVNCTNALRRAEAGGVLTMGELLHVSQLLHAMRALHDWRAHSEGMVTSLEDLFGALCVNKFLEDKIDTAVRSEDELADNASPALADIRRKIRAASARVREQLDKLIRSSTYQKFLQDAIVTMRDGRYVVPVKAECRGDVPGLVHDTSASGATLFVEPTGVVEANNAIRILQGKEKEEIDRILAELSQLVGSFADPIIAGYDYAVTLNVIFAKAHLGYQMRASVPKMGDGGRIRLNRARHPLLRPETAVPVTLELGTTFDTLVITGPNTGGKTVTLKTIGLLTLMAACGLMIPAGEESELSVFDHVFADIGDEQSIEQSLSTFSAHMTNIESILRQADARSLILIDELGAGTDPVEGAALARAILETLRGRGARVAATTHYAELKEFALQTPGVENACCEFDVATLRPTYRLLIGVPGRSNAFAISERLGIPAAVVDRARALVSDEATRFEDVVQKLESTRQSLEAEQQAAAQARAEAVQALERAKQHEAELARTRAAELERARTDARNLTARTRAQAEALLAELETLRKNADAAGSAQARAALRAGIRAMETEADPVEAKKADSGYKLPRPLKKGDRVLIFDIDKKAIVIAPADRAGQVEVQAGIIKTRVPLANLRLLESNGVTGPGTAAPHGRKPRGVTKELSRSAARTEVDLRGMTADEAIVELDRFIDAAVLSGVGQISIIHGKGTGVLRNAVTQRLRSHPNIRTFRLGVYGEGENGVTIAELK